MASEEKFTSSSKEGTKQNAILLKVSMIGDAAIGKTSLMVKYVENKFDEDYIQTLGTLNFTVFLHIVCLNISLGVNFMEKSVKVRNASITFSIWDLGGILGFL